MASRDVNTRLESTAAGIKEKKQKMIRQIEGLIHDLSYAKNALEDCLDNPMRHGKNPDGILQGNSVLLDNDCGRLQAMVQGYIEMWTIYDRIKALQHNQE